MWPRAIGTNNCSHSSLACLLLSSKSSELPAFPIKQIISLPRRIMHEHKSINHNKPNDKNNQVKFPFHKQCITDNIKMNKTNMFLC